MLQELQLYPDYQSKYVTQKNSKDLSELQTARDQIKQCENSIDVLEKEKLLLQIDLN